ncbi:hypothetical protein F4604DRAFT_1578934, partial [Suillus subluteus]
LNSVKDANWNEIHVEYSRKLLAVFLARHPNHQLVFMPLWQIKRTYLTDAFCDFYEENPLNILRILDVAQDLKILESLLDVWPFTFSLKLPHCHCTRSTRTLTSIISPEHGAEFLRAMVAFLEVKMESEKVVRMLDLAVNSRMLSLNPNAITIFLHILRNK